MGIREQALDLTRQTGVLPAIKRKDRRDLMPYVRAMYEGGARVVEVTMTTPGVLDALRCISREFGGQMLAASGTTLTAEAAEAAVAAGASILVSPAVVPDVIEVARRRAVACYIGAFTPTECLTAMRAGADMIKIFPAALGGPKYMTNLKMVFPEAELIPSGGISPETAGEFIRCGASAISGARNFTDPAEVERNGLGWITERTAYYIALVAQAKASAPPLP
jgi:2-dehydro-3-deoxyphosphogluconate aldolase/(4S)-4-hydroxy-2-oxoglutarate aldolase